MKFNCNFTIRGPLDLTKETWRTEGLKGFYRGLTSTIAREMFGYFFFFAAYEKTKFVVTNGKHENYGMINVVRMSYTESMNKLVVLN